MNKEYVVIMSPSDTNVPFYIDLLGITYENPFYRIERHKLNVTVVEYIISGSGTIIVDGKKYTASAGDMYIIPAYSHHVYYSDSVNPWKKIWFNAGGILCSELMRMYGIKDKIVFKKADGYEIMKRLLYTCESKELTDEKKQAAASLSFLEIIMLLSSIESKSDGEAQIIKKYIDMNIEKNISVQELAELIFRSKSQTIRIFKDCYGQTPYDYYLDQKIKRAVTLLGSTAMPVQEVAFRLGFSDEHYFSNIFKTKTGHTPTYYKKV